MSSRSKVALIALLSMPAFPTCTSMTAGVTGVTDLVCDGRDLINSAPSRFLITLYRTTPGQLNTGPQLAVSAPTTSSLGGGTYQQQYSTTGVPYLNMRFTPSIATGNLVIPFELENIDPSDAICTISDSIIIAWAGTPVVDGGVTRPRLFPGTSLPVRLFDDGTTAMAVISSGDYQLSYFSPPTAAASIRWGTVDSQGNGFCINPGETKRITLQFNFGPTGSSVAELAAVALAEYRTTYSNQHPDRRPVGAVFLASTASRTTNNPRGWISSLTSDLNNPNYSTKLASFEANLLGLADTTITKLAGANAQGVVIWDVEGQEVDHATSYVCDPRLVDTMAPEMASIVDAFMAKFTAAGYRVGNCLRPTQLLAQQGAVSESCSWVNPASNTRGYNIKMGMSASVPYTGEPYYCRADGNYWPRDTTVASVDTSADTITLVGDYFFTNDPISFVGTVPAPLVSAATYYVVNKVGAAFQVSSTASGAAINITSSGSGTIVTTSVRDQFNLPYEEARQILIDKVRYAKNRWGSTLFYIDTLFVSGLGEMPSKIVADLTVLFPDCVFFPEIIGGGEGGEGYWGASLPFKYSGPYAFYFVPTYFYSVSTDFQGASVYPASFNYLANIPYSGGVFTSNRENIERGLAQGSIGAFNAWFGNDYQPVASAMTASGISNKTLSMTDSSDGSSRVFTSAPATSFTYPLFMRVYFAASSEGLAASTTWCQQQALPLCFASGIKQSTAALDLSALPYYRISYYDFAGNLVSEGPYATLQ